MIALPALLMPTARTKAPLARVVGVRPASAATSRRFRKARQPRRHSGRQRRAVPGEQGLRRLYGQPARPRQDDAVQREQTLDPIDLAR